MTRSVEIFSDGPAVADAAAERLIQVLASLLQRQNLVHLSLTGGTVGVLTLSRLGQNANRNTVDWTRVHVWWGDERFVDRNSADRNANQAKDALLSNIEIPLANIHEFPSCDDTDLETARENFSLEVSKFANPESGFISFDVTLLGMGPDGHIASLFPGKNLPAAGVSVISEADSPKPPPMRLSFTYEAINASAEVWFLVAGTDKAAAVEVAFSDDPYQLPVGRISGQTATKWFIDESAIAKVQLDQLAE